MARRPLSIILSVVFGLLTLAAWGQVLQRAGDPPTLTALQFVIGLTAALTTWGSWRRTRWASGAAIAYGVTTAGMLVALPSLLGLAGEARMGIWTGAAASMVFAVACAAYFRSDARRQAGHASAT